MDAYHFTHEMEVRDYECDMQGIVNNGVYQNYLEHVRILYLKTIGIDFAEYTRKGIHLVVVRAELDYKSPLTSGDRFRVGINYQRESRLRFVFAQTIHRLPDERPVLAARIISTSLNAQGRPYLPAELDARLA